tara:strand:+ start:1636 stop:2961 length:1326 start_codon:yes stop_codon:yes gene_type:complete
MIKFLKYILLHSYHRPSAKLLHIYVSMKKIFFNNKTNIFSEKMLLLKEPPPAVIYYNFLGRFFLIMGNIISILIFNKYIDRNISIGNSENNENTNSKSNIVWPQQPIHFFENLNEKLHEDFFSTLEDEYFYSLNLLEKKDIFKDSPWWISCRDEFKKIFLEKNKLNLDSLENFRNNFKTKAALLHDQTYLSNNKSKRINKIKALSLINLYHKLSSYTDLSILRMASESLVGNNICLNYRGQRLTHRVLRHAYYSSQILTHTDLDINKKNIIMDLGGGYGGLSRILKNIYQRSSMVIIEIPEVCLMANYFIKKNFPNCKLGTVKDFKDKTNITSDDIKKFDFIILPQPFMELFGENIFDLIINTTSLGEMANEMQNYYIEHIERITSNYFYSINRAEQRVDKYNAQGFYDLNFKKRWIAKLYNFTHTYHIEFLGKKVRDDKI